MREDVGTAFTTERRSGVLLHPTSLPGPGVGDLGEAAYRFVDWLSASGQTYWQILPLGPVDAGGSPYNGLSALAGNPLLISLEMLVEDGLTATIEADPPEASASHVDFPATQRWKQQRLRAAYQAFRAGPSALLAAEFGAYRLAQQSWLGDFALFMAARDHHAAAPWYDWPPALRDRDAAAMGEWRARLADEVGLHEFQQFLFERQWERLRRYANDRGVRIIGDLPIFVALDSADVWANRDIFRLQADGAPYVVAGVPPDYFSATGQRWGNPLYRWDLLRDHDYGWWVERFRRTLEMVDILRVDHFRGFESYWEIQADEATAVRGQWVEGPGKHFFDTLRRRLGGLPLIAEDLGLITREVERLRDDLNLPGMCVLQFGFDGDPRNPHLPENCPTVAVAYTGTHDNDTIAGWWAALGSDERSRVAGWLQDRPPTNWTFIEAVFASAASIAVVPLQDVLGLGGEARMNTPGIATDNWTWRMKELPGADVGTRLLGATDLTGRLAGHADRVTSLNAEKGR